MGLFSNIMRSYKKSNRLRTLQLEYSPQHATAHDIVRDSISMLRSGGVDRKAQLLDEFLNLVEGDPSIQQVMRHYGLNREALRQIAIELMANGMGWQKDHYMPLSSIAYAEPLAFIAEAKKRGKWRIDQISNS